MEARTRAKPAAAVLALTLGIGGVCLATRGAEAQQRADEPLTVARLEQWIAAHSNWGRWGADDDLGAINLITPEKRRQAAALVRDGVSVSLAEEQIPNVEQPGRSAPYRFRFTFRPDYEEHVTTNPWTAPPPEQLTLGAHGSRSHLDALAHNFYKGQYYNGLPYTDITARGTIRGGIENLRHGVVTRGVLMDIPRLKGVPYLGPGEPIYPADLEAWERQAGASGCRRGTRCSSTRAGSPGWPPWGRSRAAPGWPRPASRGFGSATSPSSAATSRSTPCRRATRATRCRPIRCTTSPWSSWG